jgi:hypothetical protein
VIRNHFILPCNFFLLIVLNTLKARFCDRQRKPNTATPTRRLTFVREKKSFFQSSLEGEKFSVLSLSCASNRWWTLFEELCPTKEEGEKLFKSWNSSKIRLQESFAYLYIVLALLFVSNLFWSDESRSAEVEKRSQIKIPSKNRVKWRKKFFLCEKLQPLWRERRKFCETRKSIWSCHGAVFKRL